MLNKIRGLCQSAYTSAERDRLYKGIMPRKLSRTITAAVRVLALKLSLTLPSMAKPGDTIAQQLNCNNPGSNVEYKECARKAYEQADQRLNQVYRQLTSKLGSAERKELSTLR